MTVVAEVVVAALLEVEQAPQNQQQHLSINRQAMIFAILLIKAV